MTDLTVTDYLLLDYISEYAGLLDEFGRPDVDLAMNKPHHRLHAIDLTSRLIKLMEHELISFDQNDKVYSPSFPIILELLESISQTPCTQLSSSELGWNIWVQLTAKGGSYWESFFAPQWNRFHIHGIGEDEAGTGYWNVEYGSRDLLQESIDIWREYLDIQQKDICIEKITPWQATYWKSLPEGYKASFTVKNMDSSFTPPEQCERLGALHTWRKEWKFPYQPLEAV